MPTVRFNSTLVKPEIAAYLEELNRTTPASIASLTPQGIRTAIRQNIERFRTHAPFYAIDCIKDYFICESSQPLLVRVFKPNSEHQPLPILVYYHGGGWVGGSVETHENICRLLAQRCDCIVVSVDYPLAPEHKSPEIVQKCYQALCWVFQHASELNGDPLRIGVAGDSSGGNLAAVMALMAKQQHQPVIYQALICPVTNLSQLQTPSYTAYSNFGLSRDKMAWFIQCYLPNQAAATDPHVSPLLAPDLSGLPPALVIASEFDVLRDDATQYAQRLQDSGVPTTYHCMKKMIHCGFFWALGLPVIAEEIDFICENIANNLLPKRYKNK